MQPKKSTFIILTFMVVFTLRLAIPSGMAQEEFFEFFHLDERQEGYFELLDERDGSRIMRTARIVHVGDQFIDEENRLYKVIDVEGDIATVRFMRNVELAIPSHLAQASSVPADRSETPTQARRKGVIAIYHSHGAESYVPSDGSESIDEGGGILQVGETFAAALEKQGIETEHSQETHTPHDAGAYNRSRRTVEEFMKDNPDALIDVHRDAVPPEEYIENVDGEEMVQIQLVVGRQNQNMANNQEFAEGLKRVADEEYPGLIKGIFMAQGNYNQDVSPRALLLEVGAHENNREGAEGSIALFATVLNSYLYGTAEGEELTESSPDVSGSAGGTALGSAMWIILILAAGLFVYLLVAAGSWEELKRKVSGFFGREFSDLGGSKDKDNRDGGN